MASYYCEIHGRVEGRPLEEQTSRRFPEDRYQEEDYLKRHQDFVEDLKGDTLTPQQVSYAAAKFNTLSELSKAVTPPTFKARAKEAHLEYKAWVEQPLHHRERLSLGEYVCITFIPLGAIGIPVNILVQLDSSLELATKLSVPLASLLLVLLILGHYPYRWLKDAGAFKTPKSSTSWRLGTLYAESDPRVQRLLKLHESPEKALQLAAREGYQDLRREIFATQGRELSLERTQELQALEDARAQVTKELSSLGPLAPLSAKRSKSKIQDNLRGEIHG